MRLIISALRFILGTGALVFAVLAILAVLGFAVPYFDLLNHLQAVLFVGTLLSLLFVPAILRRGNWRRFMLAATATGFFASAITVVPEFAASLQPRPPVAEGRATVKVMTHNLFGMNYDMLRVLDVIRKEQPDIIAVQEFFGEQRSELAPLLKETYPYSAFCRGGKRANLGLFSKIPFEQAQDGACPDNAYADQRTAHILARFALADGSQFSLLTTHLDWPAPRMARQREEFDLLASAIQQVSGPLVVVGDFNSTSWSYALRNFTRGAGLTREDHSLLTYPTLFHYFGAWRPTLPFLPLDHVLTRDVAVHELHAASATGSDHLPVVFTMSVEKPAE
ncbi:endonuclease/exonuclease/phosphatase family protein [Paradevosia shaoguanensis]|uniref:endonuclease/exonuclease/phosphatase family protein n=1 Tax=Paradevosia shaoguanensis TaxID=1335043 RepID=UPI003C72F3C3